MSAEKTVAVTGAPTNPAYITPSTQSSAPPPYGVSAAPAHTAYTVTIPQPLADPPKDYLAWSIVTTVLCCFWFGIAAIIRSVRARDAIRIGDSAGALDASKGAKTCNILGTVFGIITIGASLAYLFLGTTTSYYG